MSRRQTGSARGETRRWQEADGRRMVAAWQRSDDSLAVFARRRGVQEQRLRYWIARLGVVPAGREAPLRFHPVRVVNEPEGHRAVTRADDRIEILLRDGRAVRVPPGATPADVRHVLQALELGDRC